MQDVVRRMPWPTGSSDVDPLLTREWLVTNGLGGYAAGTISGVVTRRYHGLLIAALPSPLGRTFMLGEVSERLKFPDYRRVELESEELAGAPPQIRSAAHLIEFRLDDGFPIWRYRAGDVEIEKRVLMPYAQNTVHVNYRLVSGDAVAIRLRPAVHFRSHDAPVSSPLQSEYKLTAWDSKYELSVDGPYPPLRMTMYGEEAAFTIYGRKLGDIVYRIEESRGYDSRGQSWSPGHFWADLAPGKDATLVASTEAWETFLALSPEQAYDAELQRRRRLISCAHPCAKQGVAAELVLAADQFIITPSGRVEDAARARAAGDEIRTVIAGYHWFTDWGRDTMISLEGLTLTTGRFVEAGWILRTFAYYVRDGLIPNMFPEGGKEGLYHTADATLWFFHAISRYIDMTGDRATLKRILPTLRDIVEHHIRGTRFNILVDQHDGLLVQGQEGYQLTWMDAKMGDWVVTPRRGKAVEINALWYNAVRLLQRWLAEEGDEQESKRLAGFADQCYESFNQRFWYEQGGYLYDVVDSEGVGDDTACRPNQVLAISLDNPVLERARWAPVMQVVQDKLLTPFGLRSLAPGHPDYHPRYFGDLKMRDAAYHQGTVWAWLIGPWIDAWLKLHPEDKSGARVFLNAFDQELSEACVGQISEVFDADPPYTARGCVAQAWSVAEVLRCWAKTEGC